MTIPAHKGFWTGQGSGAITIKTYGFDELDKALKTLPGELQQKCVEQALKYGGKEIVNAAKAKIKSRSWALAAAITLRTNKKQGTNCLVQLGPFLKTLSTKSGRMIKPYYGHMIEWGTKSHEIKGREGGVLTFMIGGRYVSVSKVEVSGITGQRPFTTAFDEKRTAFLWKFGDYVDKYIKKYFEKFFYSGF